MVSTPVPVACSTPPQQKRYSPVRALNRTTLPGIDSSTRQALNTETVKLQLAWLPEVSVAVQVTVVVPTGNMDPDAGLQTTVTPGQLSVAVAEKFTVVLVVGGQVAAAATKMFAGQVMTGGCVSLTVIVKLHIDMLFEESFTVHVTVVVPFWKVVPDAGLQLGAPTPGQLSLTAGVG